MLYDDTLSFVVDLGVVLEMLGLMVLLKEGYRTKKRHSAVWQNAATAYVQIQETFTFNILSYSPCKETLFMQRVP